MLTEKLFKTDEWVINYADGDTTKPRLVMVHGSSLNWQTFSDFIPTLEQNWHIYACDLPGHGNSGRSFTGYRGVDYVRAISTFIEQCIGQPVVLLGFSTGALVTLGVAAQIPKLIRAIISLDPPLMNREISIKQMEPYGWFSWVDETLRSTSSLEGVIARLKEANPTTTEEQAMKDARMVYSLDIESIRTLLNDRLFENFDLAHVSSKITCPALLIRGETELGGVCRDVDAAFLEARVPQIKIFQIKNCGHDVIWGEAGEESLRHITQFLKSL